MPELAAGAPGSSTPVKEPQPSTRPGPPAASVLTRASSASGPQLTPATTPSGAGMWLTLPLFLHHAERLWCGQNSAPRHTMLCYAMLCPPPQLTMCCTWNAGPGLPRPPGFTLRSDSGMADLTRTFGSGIGLSALSQRLRSRRCASHALISVLSSACQSWGRRISSCVSTKQLQAVAMSTRTSAFADHRRGEPSLHHLRCIACGNGRSPRIGPTVGPCPLRSDVASVDGFSLGGGPGGGLSPAPSPLPNALNSFFGNLQHQVRSSVVVSADHAPGRSSPKPMPSDSTDKTGKASTAVSHART